MLKTKNTKPTTAETPSQKLDRQNILHRLLNRWKANPQQALVYRATENDLDFEDVTEANKISNSFEIRLPRWRNRVYVYEDADRKRGFICTIRLDRLGVVWNMKRRLGVDYGVLHVKGDKIEEI